MKLRMITKDLTEKLKAAKKVAGGNEVQVLDNVLFQARDGQVTLTATDGNELALFCQVAGKVEEEGAYTVPVDKVYNFVATLKTDTVELWVEKDSLIVSSGAARGDFLGLPASRYPTLSPPTFGDTSIPVRDLLLAIDGTVNVTTESEHAFTRGVLLKTGAGKMVWAATDGLRVAEVETSGTLPPAELVIPGKALSVLKSLLQGDEAKITMPNRTSIAFQVADYVLIIQLVLSPFIDYKGFMPRERSMVAVVGAQDLLDLTRRAAVFSADHVRYTLVKGKHGTGRLGVATQNDLSGKSEETLEVDVHGDDDYQEAILSLPHVTDFLRSFKSKDLVCFSWGAAELPGGRQTVVVLYPHDHSGLNHMLVPLVEDIQ